MFVNEYIIPSGKIINENNSNANLSFVKNDSFIMNEDTEFFLKQKIEIYFNSSFNTR